MRRLVGDVSAPLTADGDIPSRFVVARTDSDSFRDRYGEDKTALLGIIEVDITSQSTLAIGYQNQDNNPEGTIWGTIPIFAADGSRARLPVSTSYAPEWTYWQRELGTAFADLSHRFNERWSLRAALSRTKGELSSLRVYVGPEGHICLALSIWRILPDEATSIFIAPAPPRVVRIRGVV